MSAYMYPINIDTTAQLKHYCHEVNLGDVPVTIAILQKHVKPNETLAMDDREGDTILYVYGQRFETPVEIETRVNKEKKYMHHYKKYHKLIDTATDT